MGFMHHGIQRQHDAGDLVHPCPRGNTLKQASPEHIIYGPMAPLVDGSYPPRPGPSSLLEEQSVTPIVFVAFFVLSANPQNGENSLGT